MNDGTGGSPDAFDWKETVVKKHHGSLISAEQGVPSRTFPCASWLRWLDCEERTEVACNGRACRHFFESVQAVDQPLPSNRQSIVFPDRNVSVPDVPSYPIVRGVPPRLPTAFGRLEPRHIKQPLDCQATDVTGSFE